MIPVRMVQVANSGRTDVAQMQKTRDELIREVEFLRRRVTLLEQPRPAPRPPGGRGARQEDAARPAADLPRDQEARGGARLGIRRILEKQERERQLIAYEIHDGLVQHVAGARMHLESLLLTEEVPGGRARRLLEAASEAVGKALLEARDLIRGLRSPILDEWGVVAAIGCLIEDQPVDGPSVEFVHQMPLKRLDPFLESNLYRIVQEAITNVKRHSGSDRARIQLVQVAGQIRLEIRDWGVGFEPTKVGKNHFGLEGIRERARLSGGQASIEGSPGHGTRIVVDLPVAGAPENKGRLTQRMGVLNE
ncbi:MAG: sensor histidine kinase [Acidobacteriota bacterium]